MTSPAVRVLITGAAGQIGYSLIPLVCSGKMFGPHQPVILHLLDITPAMGSLKGVAMEVEDCAWPLVAGIVFTDQPETAFRDIDYAIFLGAFPRKEGMERKDLLEKNCGIFKAQGEFLDKFAKKTVRCLVVGNPANTNACILSYYAPSIPRENISALTRLDHNRALAQVAMRAGSNVADVKNVCIWGNHSSTQYPDVHHGTVGGKPIYEAVSDKAWIEGDLVKTVQKRGAAIIELRKLSSAMSAANAVCDHMRDWTAGTAHGEFVSMAVCSNGEYGTEKGIWFSFPVQCAGGSWRIVPGLDVSDDFSQKMLKTTEQELMEERKMALNF